MRRIAWKRSSDRLGRLRQLSAWELLQAQREALCMDAPAAGFGLCLNACVLSRALQKRGRPVFPTGEAALRGLREPQIRSLIERYLAHQTEAPTAQTQTGVNPQFDAARYEELRGR